MLKSFLLLTVVCALMYTSYKLVSGSKAKTFSDQLKDIVKEVNTEKHGWTAEYNNRFDDHTEESVKQFMGLKEKSDIQQLELKQRNIRNMAKWNDLAVDIQHLLIPDSDLPETFVTQKTLGSKLQNVLTNVKKATTNLTGTILPEEEFGKNFFKKYIK